MMNMNNDRKKLKALETYNIFSSERLGTFPLSPPKKYFAQIFWHIIVLILIGKG